MILKELYLYPDLAEYPDEVVHPFRDQSRSVCNFLERELKSIKFEADGFKRMCVVGKLSPNTKCYVNTSKVLVIEVPFNEKQYLALNEGELNSYFIDMLKAGFEKSQNQFKIPTDELLSMIESFRSGGYINEWCFKSKHIKALGIKCFLNCKLTIRNFRLTMLVLKNGKTIFERRILETEPDEIVFTPMFKDICLDGDKLVVLDRFGDPVFQVLVKDLLKGVGGQAPFNE